jgi:hypothetical protein
VSGHGPDAWVQRLTSLPDDAVAVVVSDGAIPDGEEARHLVQALPHGSALVALTTAQRAILDEAMAIAETYQPERPMHGPHTRAMFEHIARTVTDLSISGSDARVWLLDNGFQGVLIMPPDALVHLGAVPEDHPLIALVREHLAHDPETPPPC